MLKNLISGLLLAVPMFLIAQGNITGRIIDKENNEPLVGATVLAYPVSDTTKRTFGITDYNGNFSIKTSVPGFYTLFINFVGYEPSKRFIRVGDTGANAGDISVAPDPKMLDMVEIKGSAPTAVIQGDTTGYDASAYKMNPDANTEDLLRKIPGVIIDRNGVQAQGEQVQRVLVDGKVFFGNDPSAALRNLPAEVVQRIEIFDQVSDQARFSGFNDGNTSKTINIVTKREFRDGVFGRAFAGAGTDAHYNLGGNINQFKGTSRLSVVGLANDINQQNFASEDLVGISSASGGGGGFGGFGGGGFGGGRPGGQRGGVNNFLVGQDQGLITTYATGINYTDKIKDKLEIESSYFFNYSDNDRVTNVVRETFLTPDTSQFYNEFNIANNRNQNHRLNLRLTYKISDKDDIIFTPSASMQLSNSTSSIVGSTSFLTNEVNATDNQTEINNIVYSFNSNLLYRHRFDKQGRTISVNINNVFSDRDGETFLDAVNTFGRLISRTDTITQFTDTDIRNRTNGVNLTFTEQVTEKMQLSVSYANSFTRNDADQLAFTGSERDELTPALSSSFLNRFNRQTVTTGLFFRTDKTFGRVALAYQDANLTSEQVFPTLFDGERNFKNVLPTAFVRINLTKEKNLRLVYRTQTDEPTIGQLQSVINNSNPIRLTTGNPDLKQAYTHLAIVRYSQTNLNKGTSLFGFIFARTASNFIANETTIARTPTPLTDDITLGTGAQLIRPINVQGFWNLRSLVTYTVPAAFIKSNVTFGTGYNFTRTPGIINGLENLSLNNNFNQSITIASNFSQKIDFTVSVNANYNAVNNSLQPELNNNFFTNISSFRLNWIFGNGFVMRQDINHQMFRGLNSAFNQDFILWNASIGKKIFANEQGEISLNIFDLLNQNNSITRTVTETFVEDTRTNILRQYFMLTFTYNIKKFNTAAGPMNPSGGM